MVKKIFIAIAALLFVGSLAGCLTTNWVHNRRHFKKIRQELHELHVEIDRVFFDLDEAPGEGESYK